MMKYEHANDEGTGSRLVVDFDSDAISGDGYIVMAIQPQSGPKGAGGDASYSEEGEVSIALNAVGCAHLLNVLDGDAESILGGKGWRTKVGDETMTLFADRTDGRPFEGYAIHLRRSAGGYKEDRRIVLSLTEGSALALAVISAIGKVAFGDKI